MGHTIEIKSDKLIKIWSGQYKDTFQYSQYYHGVDQDKRNIVHFYDHSLDEDLYISNLNLPHLHLKNCKTKAIHISASTIASLSFSENSEIGIIVIDEKSTIGKIDSTMSSTGFLSIDGESTVGTLNFKNSELKGFLSIAGKSDTGDILFSNSSVLTDISVNEGSTTGEIIIASKSNIGRINTKSSAIGSLKIENSTFDTIELSSNSKSGDIEFKGVGSSFYLKVDDSKLKQISIDEHSNCRLITLTQSITEGINIHTHSVVGSFHINNSTTSYFNIMYGSSIEFLRVENKSNMGTISAFKSTIGSITIEDFSHIHAIILERLSGESTQLMIKRSLVQRISLALDKPYHANISEYSTVHTLDLCNKILSKDIYFQISDTYVNEILLETFINQSIIVFNNLLPLNRLLRFKTNDGLIPIINGEGLYEFDETVEKTRLSIINSDLGRAQFIGCNLQQFDEFLFLNSKILEVFVADTILPEKDQIGTIKGEHVSNDRKALFAKELEYNLKIKKNDVNVLENILIVIEQQRLAMSQFKKIYENRGDVVRATEYHAHEMEAYRTYLKFAPKGKGKMWWNSIGEYINLSLNNFSSYYGNNWLRAVFTTLVMNTILFALYCFLLGFTLGSDYELFWKLVSYSPEFLNPIRKADFLKDITKTTEPARIVDYLSRIIMAYFVYQTIQAFRKFGKKSA